MGKTHRLFRTWGRKASRMGKTRRLFRTWGRTSRMGTLHPTLQARIPFCRYNLLHLFRTSFHSSISPMLQSPYFRGFAHLHFRLTNQKKIQAKRGFLSSPLPLYWFHHNEEVPCHKKRARSLAIFMFFPILSFFLPLF